MSAVWDDSALIDAITNALAKCLIDAFNNAMAKYLEKHEVVGESSKTNQRKLETKLAGGHDDHKNSNDSSLQIREEEVRKEQTEDDADISVPPTHEEDAHKAAVDMKKPPIVNAFNKAMAKYPDPTGLCSKSSGTMSAVCDDSAFINALNKAMANHPEKHEVVGKSSKTNQRKLETKVAGGHDDQKNSNDSSLQIWEEEVRKEQTEDDADISVPPTHEEDAEKAAVDMKQHPTGLCSKSSGTMSAVRDDSAVINAFDKAMAKYPDPIGLCSKSSGTMSAVWDDSAAINAFNKAMGKHPVKHEVVGKSSKTNQRKLDTKVAGGHDDQKNSNDSSLQIRGEEVRKEQTKDDAAISVPPTPEEDAEKAAVDMKQHPTGLCSKSSGTMFAVRDDSAVINAFDKAMAKYPDPTGLCSKSSGTMSAVWDDSAFTNAWNKAMANYPEKHEVVGKSSKTNQRKLDTKVAGGHDDQKNSNDSSLQIWEEEVRREQTEDDADISVPPTHEEDAEKAGVDMKQHPTINAFNKAMAKDPDPTGLCSKSSGTMSAVWDDWGLIDAFNKAMAKYPEKHEVVGKSSKTNQRMLETKVAGGHDDHKNSNDSSLQIREEEVRKEQTEDDADISVPPTHEEDADKATVDMKQRPIINAFNKAMAKYPDPTGLCSKSSGTMSLVWDKSAFMDALNKAMAKDPEKHEVVGKSSKTNQRKLDTKVAGGHDDQKNSNDSSLQIREEEVRKEQTEDDADISVPPTHEEDAEKAGVDMKQPPIINAFNKAMAKDPDPTGLCSKSSGTMSAVWDDSAFVNALNKAMANHPEKHEVVGKSSKTNQRKLETKVAGGHDDHKNSNDSSLQIREEEVRKEQTEDDADISVPPTHEEDAHKAAVDMKQHPCQETYSANLEEQQAPTRPIDEVEKAAELEWQPWHQVWQQLQELEQQQNMLYQQLYHLGAYPMGQGTSSLQPSTDNGTTEQLTAAHVDVSNAHYFPYHSAHAQGWASYPSPPFYQACWSCRQPHEPLATAPCLAQYGHDSHLGNPCQVARPPSVKDPAAFATMVATEAVGAVKSGVSVKNASTSGTNPEEEKDGISEMLLAWFQAGYSTARYLERQG